MSDIWAKILLRKELKRQIADTEKKLDNLRNAYEKMQKDRVIVKWLNRQKEHL